MISDMKIALFTDTYKPQVNGVTNTLARLEQYFTKNHIDYKILAPDYEGKVLISKQVETFYSLQFFLYPECRLSLASSRRVQEIMKDFKPDVIHMVTEFNMGWAGMQSAKKLNIPSISTFTTNFPAYLKYYKLEALQPILWEYFRWYHNQNALTVCPSQDTKKELIENGLHSVDVWGRGIDTQLYTPQKRSLMLRKQLGLENHIILLYVGRIAVEKDLDVLFDAYRSLQNSSSKKVALVLAGDGPMLDKYKKEYENRNVYFLGYVKGEALASLYASSDVFVFPSSTETLGNVVLEAMASGLPIVAVDSGGVRDNIIPGVNGFLQKPRDAHSFVEALHRLIENEAVRISMGKEARKYALTKSWDCIFDYLMEVYNRVIEMQKQKAA